MVIYICILPILDIYNQRWYFMKVVGIVSEYNPFHNGHKYHLEFSKELCTAEYSVTIMSGSFLQRGEPALFDKWSRARMAVLNGIDLVLELPVVYSCQTAELFAFGAVKILNSLGIVDYLSFGSECGDIDELYKVSETLLNEPQEIKNEIKLKMSKGMTYSKAIGEAFRNFYGNILSSPNNVLGIEYIKSIITLNSLIKPITIKRVVNSYKDISFTGTVSSATAIREGLRIDGMTKDIQLSTPPESWNIILQNLQKGKGPIFWEDFSDILLYELRKSSLYSINNLPEIKEGLEYRLIKAIKSSSNFDELIASLKTKRYTRTSLQRTLCHMLLGMKKEDLSYSKMPDTPAYIRVLAFNDKGRHLLKEIKNKSSFSIINKPADFKPQSEYLKRIFYLDTLSTDIYNLAYKNKLYNKAGEDYITSPLYIEKL